MTGDAAHLMEPVARRLLGEPNAALSKPKEWRYGTNGSLAIDLQKGVWFDHEAGEGGGVLDLIGRVLGLANGATGAAAEWLETEGFTVPADDAPRLSFAERIVCSYRYELASGAHAFDVVRLRNPKTSLQRAPNGDWKVKGIRPVLYRLPQLLASPQGALVFVVEGEKDVEALASLGLVATTNPGGVGKWRPAYARDLAGRRVVILPDNDDRGREHAKAVRASLAGACIAWAIITLDGLPHKGDVSDWLNTGGTADQLVSLAEAALEAARTDTTDGPADPEPKPGGLSGYIGLLDSAAFMAGMRPPSFLVEKLVQRGYCYLLTGMTGHAKTASLLLMTACIARGEAFCGLPVKQGSVLILAGENPDNIRYQWYALCADLGVDPGSLPVYWHPGHSGLAAATDRLASDAAKIPNLRLVAADTLQAFSGVAVENDNVEMLESARCFRDLTKLEGAPTVLIPAHPVKNARKDNLLPRGGSAILDELDGNLTIWRDEGIATIHWQGKHRGPSFDTLKLEIVRTEPAGLCDENGRQMPCAVARPLLVLREEELAKAAQSNEDRALAAIQRNPTISGRAIADSLGVSKSSAYRLIDRLRDELKWIKKKGRGCVLTPDGEAVLDA